MGADGRETMCQRGRVDDIDIRPLAEHERRAATDALRAALLSGPINDELFTASAASWDDCDAVGAWDGDRCVGNVGAFRFDSTVPGGARVTTAGITRVGVLPTHTRRGLLTQMMQRLLRDSRERDNVLATLHASETSIYRRYGFALATDSIGAFVTPRSATPLRVAPTPGSMRLLAYGEVLDVVPDLYDRAARWRVGSITRPSWWWKRTLKEACEPVSTPYGKGSFVAVHCDADGTDDGYVYYEVDWDEGFASNPVGAGKVHDLWGASPVVEIELWRYLLEIDLIVGWEAAIRPLDEPVRRAMSDTRAYETRQQLDDQWVRILDVDAALAARTFGDSAGAVAIAVTDPMFADNSATWSIANGRATHTDAQPDVEVDIAALSAAYLGAVSWHGLAAAGEIDPTLAPAVLDRLDAAFMSQPAPFCGTGY